MEKFLGKIRYFQEELSDSGEPIITFPEYVPKSCIVLNEIHNIRDERIRRGLWILVFIAVWNGADLIKGVRVIQQCQNNSKIPTDVNFGFIFYSNSECIEGFFEDKMQAYNSTPTLFVKDGKVVYQDDQELLLMKISELVEEKF